MWKYLIVKSMHFNYEIKPQQNIILHPDITALDFNLMKHYPESRLTIFIPMTKDRKQNI